MNATVTELMTALAEKGELLTRLKILLDEEQDCLTALDLERLDDNQQAMGEAMAELARLEERCRGLIGTLAGDLGLIGQVSLSPIIEKLPHPQREALRRAQEEILARSQAMGSTLAVNRGLLMDSLKVVERSVNFFNRLFNPGETYGMAGSLVARRGGSRFVCKEA